MKRMSSTQEVCPNLLFAGRVHPTCLPLSTVALHRIHILASWACSKYIPDPEAITWNQWSPCTLHDFGLRKFFSAGASHKYNVWAYTLVTEIVGRACYCFTPIIIKLPVASYQVEPDTSTRDLRDCFTFSTTVRVNSKTSFILFFGSDLHPGSPIPLWFKIKNLQWSFTLNQFSNNRESWQSALLANSLLVGLSKIWCANMHGCKSNLTQETFRLFLFSATLLYPNVYSTEAL
jgi:hypothetical protein